MTAAGTRGPGWRGDRRGGQGAGQGLQGGAPHEYSVASGLRQAAEAESGGEMRHPRGTAPASMARGRGQGQGTGLQEAGPPSPGAGLARALVVGEGVMDFHGRRKWAADLLRRSARPGPPHCQRR